LIVEVRDNGKGFNPERLPKDRLGISTSIKARMELIGGKAQVSSTPGNGTTVILSWAK
jgi:signal transduction histidine kinase